jgi:hypothetical protein
VRRTLSIALGEKEIGQFCPRDPPAALKSEVQQRCEHVRRIWQHRALSDFDPAIPDREKANWRRGGHPDTSGPSGGDSRVAKKLESCRHRSVIAIVTQA